MDRSENLKLLFDKGDLWLGDVQKKLANMDLQDFLYVSVREPEIVSG